VRTRHVVLKRSFPPNVVSPNCRTRAPKFSRFSVHGISLSNQTHPFSFKRRASKQNGVLLPKTLAPRPGTYCRLSHNRSRQNCYTSSSPGVFAFEDYREIMSKPGETVQPLPDQSDFLLTRFRELDAPPPKTATFRTGISIRNTFASTRLITPCVTLVSGPHLLKPCFDTPSSSPNGLSFPLVVF